MIAPFALRSLISNVNCSQVLLCALQKLSYPLYQKHHWLWRVLNPLYEDVIEELRQLLLLKLAFRAEC